MASPGAREISLKRGGTWQGMGDASAFAPSTSQFLLLKNCQINRDGTEIVRMPGLVVSAKPDYLDESPDQTTVFGIIATATTNPAVLTLNKNSQLPDTGATQFWLCYVSGSTDVPTGWYPCRRTGATTIELNYDNSGGAGSVDGVVTISRVDGTRTPHVMRAINGVACIAAETITSDATAASTFRHIGVWASSSVLSISSPPRRFAQWASSVNQRYRVAGDTDADMPVRRKMSPDVARDNLLLACPGFGHLMEAPVSRLRQFETAGSIAFGKTVRPLGVPKAAIKSAVFATNATAPWTNGQWVYVAVGFQDKLTGELGLATEPFKVTNGTGGNAQLNIVVYLMQVMLLECMDLNVVIYLSPDDASNSGVMRPVWIEPAATGTSPITQNAISIDTQQKKDPMAVGLDSDRRFPFVIEGMPMGGSWVKTVRGVTWAGGAIAAGLGTSSDKLDFELIQVTDIAGAPTVFDIDSTPPATHSRMQARYGIGYGHQGSIANIDSASGNTKYRLVSKKGGALEFLRWQFDGKFTSPAGTSQTIRVDMPKGQAWFSETGHPGITPGQNRLVIDRLRGADIRAAARYGDAILLMTERETYLVRWGRSPRGEDPILVSYEHGCIAPNSVIEGDGWAAWISHEGPVWFTGAGVQWIGTTISDRWRNTYKRDSDGMMPHAVGCHDLERNLLLWGLISEHSVTYYTGTDDAKSKLPCDEILCWNYHTNAWSVWQIGGNRRIFDIARMMHDDGLWRSAVISAEKDAGTSLATAGDVVGEHYHVYSMDDLYYDHRSSLIQGSTLQAPFVDGSGTWFVGLGSWASAVRVGHEAFVVAPDSDGVARAVWMGSILEVDTASTNNRVRLSDPPSTTAWSNAATINIGTIIMEIKTDLERLGGQRSQTNISAVVLEHSMTFAINNSIFIAYARVTVINEDGTEVALHSAYSEPLSGNLTRLQGGTVLGNEHTIRVRIVANGVIHLKNISLEVAQ